MSIQNDNGNIATTNIRAEGQNHGNGGTVGLDAGTTGGVAVNGVIYTYGDRDATMASMVGTKAGDIAIKGANVTIAKAININGGNSKGTAGEVGGNAGNLKIESAGLVSTQAIVANGGNAGSTTGSAGGGAGNVSIHSSGAGDITLTTVSARTGYARGTATATGAGSVTIENDDGKLTATSISTRGQRRGVGGEVLAISAGDFNVTTVDARSSNLTAADDGDITIGTKITGDATVNSVLTGARWLVYSGDPRNDTVGTFKASADFKEYNKNYGDTLTDTSGDGFVYRVAPVISSTLTGSVSKVYDTNTNVTDTTGLTFNQGGAIDGDVVTLAVAPGATYDNKNVGTGKTVTSNVVTVTGATNGTTQVYGYQATAAKGDIGIITPASLTVVGQTADDKVYDGTAVATLTGGTLSGVLGADAVGLVAGSANFADKNVGTNKVATVTDSSLSGTDAGNYVVANPTGLTADITPKALTITAVTDTKVYDGNTTSTAAPVITGLVGGDTASVTQTFDNKNAGTGKTLTAAGVVSDGNGGNNYVTTFVADNTGVVTPRNIAINVDSGQQKVEGNTDPLPFTYTIGGLGLVGGDTLTGDLSRVDGEAVGGYAINQGSLNADSNYSVTYVGGVFNVVAGANPVGSPRTTAGLGGVIDVTSQPQSLVVLDVNPTAAGGDLTDVCSDNQGGASNNPNAAVMLNFGVSLPGGVSKTCISDGPSS